MSDEGALKVGRGGAGNFHTKADIDNATIPPHNSSSSPPRTDTQAEPSTYARTGRGGIGNYIAPPQGLSSSSSSSGSNDVQVAREVLDAGKAKLKDKITADKGASHRGHSGRGGAGNWTQKMEEVEKRKTEEEQMEVRSKMGESIRLDVERGLKPPPKIYAGPENTFVRGG